MEIEEAILENHEYHDMTELKEQVETFLEKDSHKRKPTWAWELIQEAERYGDQEGIHRERKRENTYNSYVALYMTSLIENLPPMKNLHKRNNGRML